MAESTSVEVRTLRELKLAVTRATSLVCISPESKAMKELQPLLADSIKGELTGIASHLYSKGLLTEHEYESALLNGSGHEPSVKARKIVLAATTKISINPGSFHLFVDVLRNYVWSVDCVDKLMYIYESYRVECESNSNPQEGDGIGFVCPYCQKCSLEEHLENGCPIATWRGCEEICFPYLNTQNLSVDERETMKEKLTADFKDVNKSFTKLCLYCIRTFHAENKIGELKTCLLTSTSTSTLQDEEKAAVRQSQTVEQVFNNVILPDHASFFNFEILEEIIAIIGSQKDKEKLEEYKGILTQYAKRGAFEVPPSRFHPPLDRTKNKFFALKLDKHPTLETVKRECIQIAKIFNIKHQSQLRLVSIKEGCVILRFAVPIAVAKDLFPLLEAKREMLQASGFVVQDSYIDHLGEQLFVASHHGRARKVRTLLEQGAPANWKNKRGWTPLMIACLMNRVDVVKELLEYSFDVNQQTSNRQTALHIACWRGSTECVQLLLATGQCNLEIMDKDEMTPLGEAVQWGKLDVVKLFITQYKVDIYAPVAKNGDTLLGLAIRGDKLDIVKYLVSKFKMNIKSTVNVDSGDTPLGLAVNLNRPDIVEYLTESLKVPNDKDNQRMRAKSLVSVYDLAPTKLFRCQASLKALGGKTRPKSLVSFDDVAPTKLFRCQAPITDTNQW